ncbi:MAG: alpha/beta fold hydrolase [Bacterioplanes sp.]|nr:alpha/beta fold hydrolase [Bacterioplanes sp.]
MSIEQSMDIPGPEGRLQALFGDAKQGQVGVLVCHPHPLFDGTMTNKVVSTVVRSAAKLDLPTLRFNFRGVGRSEGIHDHGRGEQDDVLAVLDYAQQTLGWQRVLLVGFSFGAGMACLVAPKVAERLSGLFMIAPAVHHFAAPSSLPYEFETFVYMGDADEVVPFDDVVQWVERVVPMPEFTIYSEGGHFFHGRLAELGSSLQADFQHVLAS